MSAIYSRRKFLHRSLRVGAATAIGIRSSSAVAWTATHMRRSSATTAKTFAQMISDNALQLGLILCLDAGSAGSYDGSSQTWTDVSGNGADFTRGPTTAAEASDPTFNGTAGGLNSSNYFTFDGGDYLTQTNSTWGVGSFHQDNATFTLVSLVYLSTNTSSQSLFHNYAGTAQCGVGFNLTSTGKLQFRCVNGTGTAAATSTSTTSFPINQWSMIAVSVNESSTTGGLFAINNSTNSFDPTYTTPGTAAPLYPSKIGVIGDATGQFLHASTRMAGFMAWNRALSSTELSTLYTQFKAQRLSTLP